MTDPNTTPTTSPTVTPPEDIHRLETQRRANRDAVAELGLNPYGSRTDDLITLADARRAYSPEADDAHKEWEQTAKAARDAGDPEPGFTDQRPVVRVAGRVVLKRDGGKLVWVQLRDHTTGPASWFDDDADSSGGDGSDSRTAGVTPDLWRARGVLPDLQIAVSKKDVAEPGFDFAKTLDLGDLVVAEGPLVKTRKGEITVWAAALSPGAKSLVPPPEKWSGLQDVELRYRKRYLDMWSNPDATWALQMRSRIVGRIRRYLDDLRFLEVETPVLQSQAGGAAARPFRTHMNALDLPLFLRIAPELFLKRLLVGGLPRVYEISRNFRNEGLDRSHNPEFTSLEVYEAFGNYETMLDLTEGLVRACAWFIVTGHDRGWEGLRDHGGEGEGHLTLPFGDRTIDYGSAFRRVTYAELFQTALGFPITDRDKTRAECESRGFKTVTDAGEPVDHILLVNELFEEVAEPTIDPAKPTFVLDYPAALSPLTRPRTDDPSLAERWDLFIGGMEIGPAYTELNDPDVQAQKFREQLAGIDDEESTFRTFDADFVEALKVAMPPAGGMGLGVDRLCMLLLNQPSIRDVIAFPMMRPLAADDATEP